MMRQQRMLSDAISNVRSVLKLEKSTRDVYGGLCHKFPVLIRSCGLCQAVAFLSSKASESASEESFRAVAHNRMLEHVSSVLKAEGLGNANGAKILESIADMSVEEYALATRVLLRAWIYYKRFAESILNVKAGEDTSNP